MKCSYKKLLVFFLLPINEALTHRQPRILFLTNEKNDAYALLLVLLEELLHRKYRSTHMPFR